MRRAWSSSPSSLCGIAAPHLPDQQRRLGAAVPDGAPRDRGDLVFGEGGGGLMIDDLLMIHASRAAGKVTVEPAAMPRDRLDPPPPLSRRLHFGRRETISLPPR